MILFRSLESFRRKMWPGTPAPRSALRPEGGSWHRPHLPESPPGPLSRSLHFVLDHIETGCVLNFRKVYCLTRLFPPHITADLQYRYVVHNSPMRYRRLNPVDIHPADQPQLNRDHDQCVFAKYRCHPPAAYYRSWIHCTVYGPFCNRGARGRRALVRGLLPGPSSHHHRRSATIRRISGGMLLGSSARPHASRRIFAADDRDHGGRAVC